MMEFTHNEWFQRDIINNIIILTKWGAYKIYTIITDEISEVSINHNT